MKLAELKALVTVEDVKAWDNKFMDDGKIALTMKNLKKLSGGEFKKVAESWEKSAKTYTTLNKMIDSLSKQAKQIEQGIEIFNNENKIIAKLEKYLGKKNSETNPKNKKDLNELKIALAEAAQQVVKNAGNTLNTKLKSAKDALTKAESA